MWRRGVSGNECRRLVQALLQMDPAKRLSAKDALNHPYFTGNEDGPLERLLDPR
jgi:serine/threonine protein kinase